MDDFNNLVSSPLRHIEEIRRYSWPQATGLAAFRNNRFKNIAVNLDGAEPLFGIVLDLTPDPASVWVIPRPDAVTIPTGLYSTQSEPFILERENPRTVWLPWLRQGGQVVARYSVEAFESRVRGMNIGDE